MVSYLLVFKGGAVLAAFTEKAIVESFIELLNEKPLDKITVKNVIDRCGVNRSTFYYYFEDIYDLLNKIFEHETGKIKESTREYDGTHWADGVMEIMSFAMDNRKAIYHVYKSVSREKLESYLNTALDDITYNSVKSKAGDIKASDEDIRLVSNVYKYAIIGLIFQWLEEGMKEEPSDIIHKLEYIANNTIHEMLVSAAQYQK